MRFRLSLLVSFSLFVATSGGAPLTLIGEGEAPAKILVEAGAKEESVTLTKAKKEIPSKRYHEWKAANDLAAYMEKMTGTRPPVVTDPGEIEAALNGSAPVLVVGELASKTVPGLSETLRKTARPTKIFDADAIVLRREGSRVFLMGSNDRSHYFAVAKLLRDWGCRWYLPTEFGEVVPERKELTVDQLDLAYAPPFEMRGYWIGWNGSDEGKADFAVRNFMNNERLPSSHGLKKYIKELIPEGKTHFNVPISAPETVNHVVEQLDEAFAAGKAISLSMEDGVYLSDYAGDRERIAGMHDKYFLSPVMTDAFWTFYNEVASALAKRHPESKAVIGFLGYTNITLPPQRDLPAAKPLALDLAPIDIDPNHAFGDPRSPSKQEFGEMVRRWAEIMNGKMAIYDYDQSSLLWRDIPNPSHQVFEKDVKFYRDLGIMGVVSESRNATATIFTNLHFRGQLLWDPDVEVKPLLDEFYDGFYGPLSAPMRAYWSAIYQAWEETTATEHEYYMIPAIYTPALVETLRGHLAQAKRLAEPLRKKGEPGTREKRILERLEFTEKSFALIDLYVALWKAAATEGDYATAGRLGREMLATRRALAEMNPTFTTRIVGRLTESPEPKPGLDAAWLSGEVQQYLELEELTDGRRGKLVSRLPLEWAFRRDPHDTGLARGFARQEADLSYWEKQKANYETAAQRKDYPTTEWETVRTDLYAQAQGILHPDWQSFTGYLWYKTPLKLTKAQAVADTRLHFPGLFGEAWLYVNGELVAHRPQNQMWWKNSYRFEWDVDLNGKLKAGTNDITVRIYNIHHNGGIFRRPFLYQPVAAKP